MSNTLRYALIYIERGFCPLPIWPDVQKNPHLRGDISEYNHRLPRSDEWQRWIKRWPDTNIGLITGYHHLCGLDFDDYETMDLWARTAGKRFIGRTWTVRTARGYHIYFIVNGETGKSRNFERDGQKVLLRAKGGYCIAPPSVHHTGARYTSEVRLPPVAVSSIDEILLGWTEIAEAKPVEAKRPVLGGGYKGLSTNSITTIRIEDLINVGGKAHGETIQIRCPFHDDKHPSAWVNLEQQRFGCHVCLGGGRYLDAVNVYALLNNMSNSQAYAKLKADGLIMSREVTQEEDLLLDLLPR